MPPFLPLPLPSLSPSASPSPLPLPSPLPSPSIAPSCHFDGAMASISLPKRGTGTKGAPVSSFFDEMYTPDGAVREAYSALSKWLADTPPERLKAKRAEAELLFRRLGITFLVYGREGGTERLIPFDVIPRVFACLLYTSPSPRDVEESRMPSSA